jgi:hypothetical protein
MRASRPRLVHYRSPAVNDWRAYRPAIWLSMLGIAVILIVVPHYLGAIFLGAGIGAAIRIRQRRARRR